MWRFASRKYRIKAGLVPDSPEEPQGFTDDVRHRPSKRQYFLPATVRSYRTFNMRNPFNPLDWFSTAQEWFAKTEKSSGFRPFLIYQILSVSAGLVLLFAFPARPAIEIVALIAIALPILSFVPLYAWKAQKDPDFCRSETHVQRVKKIELEMMGSESKQIPADVLEQKSITSSIKEPLLIEGDAQPGTPE